MFLLETRGLNNSQVFLLIQFFHLLNLIPERSFLSNSALPSIINTPLIDTGKSIIENANGLHLVIVSRLY